MPEDAKDPFQVLVFEWSWAVFDRAICAHMRGDDALALADCRELDAVRPKLETEADRRGFERSEDFFTPTHPKLPHFSFLEPVPKLLADEQRRVKEGPHRTVLETGRDKFPDKTGRIRALIADLEEVNARQWGQPGGVALNFDPIVLALVAEGEEAVEPLLDCLEHDPRLTRSVRFGRDFGTDRDVLSVQKAAEAALNEILKVRFEAPAGYRNYWRKYHAQPMAERWYRTLLDDQAGRGPWMEAARNILSRTDGTNVYLPGNAPKPDATNHYTLAGESLRAKNDPSISDLLARRAMLIAPKSYGSSEDCWTFEDAADLGLLLAEWDKDAAVPALAQIIRRCPAVTYSPHEVWGSGCAVVVTRFAAVAVGMAELGDTTGLDLYANWLRDKKLADLEDAFPGGLSPLGAISESSVHQGGPPPIIPPGKW